MEKISKKPTAKKTTTISSFKKPVVSPLGANKCSRNPIGPTSRIAQISQHAKKTSAIANVIFKSALAPRNQGTDTCSAAKGRTLFAFGGPYPIDPKPGINPTQFENRMKMKTVAKNQKVF